MQVVIGTLLLLQRVVVRLLLLPGGDMRDAIVTLLLAVAASLLLIIALPLFSRRLTRLWHVVVIGVVLLVGRVVARLFLLSVDDAKVIVERSLLAVMASPLLVISLPLC